MTYFDRRLLLPVAAVTAWAQQPSPEAAAAEAALRARAEQFFQLQVDKKYRQAESMVADDTKDEYYNGNRFNIRNFQIQKIELLDNNTKAKVTIKAGVTLIAPGMPKMDLDTPNISTWKLENGQWVWYAEKNPENQTPFGVFRSTANSGSPSASALPLRPPDPSKLSHPVALDKDSVELTVGGPRQSVTISNNLPGAIDLAVVGDPAAQLGLKVEIAKKHLAAGETTRVYIEGDGSRPKSGTVKITVSPVSAELAIGVNAH